MRPPRRREGPAPEPGASRWVCGRHVVEETLRSDKCKVLELWLLDRDRDAHGGLLADARRAGVQVRWVNRGQLERVCPGESHQGMAASIADKPGADLGEFLSGLEDGLKRRMVLVALDQIQDPQNFGAIARAAACLGASGVIYPERRSAPLTAAVLRASAGAIQKIRTFSVVNLSQALRRLKENGFWIYGADPAGRRAWDAPLNRPLVLVIGSEGHGIRDLVRAQCDELVAIPQSSGGVASLNASCAAAVLLYEAARQGAA